MKRMGMIMLAPGAVKAAVSATFEIETGRLELGPYRSTTFSEFIGSFDSNCNLNSTAIFLNVDASQNPCEKETIKVDLNGKIVVVSDLPSYGCFEETSYTNLESLGAVAVLNADQQPPGSTRYKYNFGKDVGAGSVPFLDLGLEFYIDVLDRAASTDNPVQLLISGCDDSNPFTTCVEVVAPILSAFVSIFLFYFSFLATKVATSLPKTKGTWPRIYILCNIAAACFVVGMLQLLNFVYIDSYIWIVDGQIYSGLERLGTGISTAFSYNVVLLCAYYWLYLEGQCFYNRRAQGDSRIKNFFILNSRKSFFQRFEFKVLQVVSFALLVYTSIQSLRVDADFILLSASFFYLDLALSICFVITNYSFVTKATQTVKSGSGDMTAYIRNHRSLDACGEFRDKLTGRSLKAYLRDTKSFPGQMSRSTLHLTLHLGYWLQFFALGVFLLSIVQLTMAIPLSSVGRYEDDWIMDSCGYLLPPFLIMCMKSLMFYPLIRGIEGPGEVLSDKDADTASVTNSPKGIGFVSPVSSYSPTGYSPAGRSRPPTSIASTPGVSKLRHVGL